MNNLTDINKILKRLQILQSISIVLGFISFCAVYSWIYPFDGALALIGALIPGFLCVWSYEIIEDIKKSMLCFKTNVQEDKQ